MGTKERKDREKQIRLEEIIKAAEHVFYEKGVDQSTMDDIATRAEFTKKTVYNYFTNKEELIAAVLLKELKHLYSIFKDAFDKGGTGFDRIHNIGHTYIDFYYNHPIAFKLLSHFKMLPALNPDSPTWKEVTDMNGRTMGLMIECIKIGIEDGSVRKDLDPKMAAFYVGSISNGMLETISRSGQMLEKLFDIKVENFISYCLGMIGYSIKSQDKTEEK